MVFEISSRVLRINSSFILASRPCSRPRLWLILPNLYSLVQLRLKWTLSLFQLILNILIMLYSILLSLIPVIIPVQKIFSCFGWKLLFFDRFLLIAIDICNNQIIIKSLVLHHCVLLRIGTSCKTLEISQNSWWLIQHLRWLIH